MLIIKPVYYDEFKCIGGSCPKSCCEGWQIVIDDDSLEKYEREEGAFGSRLLNSINFEEGTFLQYNKRCAFLNDENLCDLQCELGEDALCETCRRYPRHIEEYEGVREYSLSLSCPVAARTMITYKNKLTFTEVENDIEDDFEEFDYLMYDKVVEARKVIYEIIQNREMDIHTRMSTLREFALSLQECLDDDRLFDMDDVIADYDKKLHGKNEEACSECNNEDGCDKQVEEHINNDQLSIAFDKARDKFKLLYELEHLDADFEEVLKKAESRLFDGGAENYYNIMKAVDGLDVETEQLLMFFVYTYFCGSVYDDWIYSKMELAVQSVLWIMELTAAASVDSDEEITEILIRNAYIYAREAEHSDINLNLLEERFMDEKWLIFGR